MSSGPPAWMWAAIAGGIALGWWLCRRPARPLEQLDWRQFEAAVAEGYRALGWQVTEAGGPSADGGVDLIARDAEETWLIQCKHWPGRRVGVQPVRELYGVMCAAEADGAALVTSGTFSRAARAFAEGKAMELVEGRALAALVGRKLRA